MSAAATAITPSAAALRVTSTRKSRARNKPVATTTIYFADGQRAAADEVAGVLGLPATSVKAMDASISAVAGPAANVVVVVGADQIS